MVAADTWPSMAESVFTSMPCCSESVAKVCPYGIITTNRKRPIYQGFEGFLSAFLSFSKIKKKLIKIVKPRRCYISDKTEYHVNSLIST